MMIALRSTILCNRHGCVEGKNELGVIFVKWVSATLVPSCGVGPSSMYEVGGQGGSSQCQEGQQQLTKRSGNFKAQSALSASMGTEKSCRAAARPSNHQGLGNDVHPGELLNNCSQERCTACVPYIRISKVLFRKSILISSTKRIVRFLQVF